MHENDRINGQMKEYKVRGRRRLEKTAEKPGICRMRVMVKGTHMDSHQSVHHIEHFLAHHVKHDDTLVYCT